MASGFGVDATVNASTKEVVSSTTSQDIRRILGALYSPGLIAGGGITTSASSLAYTVNAGVAAIRTANGQVVLAPFDTTSLPTTSPTSNTRTDMIYVKQNFPTDGNSNVVVGIGTSLPPNSLRIGSFIVPAGATSTNAAVRAGNVDYSIPYGASLGILHQYTDTRDGQLPDTRVKVNQAKIYLPTDRRLRLTISSNMSSVGAVKYDNNLYAEWGFYPEVDGTMLTEWTTSGLHQAWAMYQFEYYVNVPAGEHTVGYSGGRIVGPGHAWHHYSATRRGTVFTVEDAGVAV